MIKTQELISTARFNKGWKSITNLEPTEFKEIIQTKSSVQNIASSLNEAEISALKELGDWHGNKKYPYPYWKVCDQCEKIFPTMDRAQAKRNTTCSQKCQNKIVGEANSGKNSPEETDYLVKMECDQCGETFSKRKDRIRKDRGDFCSKNCYGEWMSKSKKIQNHMREIAPLGELSEKALKKKKERMTGSSNPSWKGGVTHEKKRGNYDNPVLVRCPEKFSEMARKNGYVLEHRLKVAKEIGRPLKSEEVVHHIDHDPQNNDIENLMLFRNNREHKLYEHNGNPEPIWQPSNQ